MSVNKQERPVQKEHWEKVYNTKQLTEVSWYEPRPQVSLDFVKSLGIKPDQSVIDIGGGDSLFADHLLALGFKDITVLDISEAAINRARQRLGKRADEVNWIVSDVLEFQPQQSYDCWHDRAAFHFLTTEEQVQKYLTIAHKALAKEGKIVMGTFSENGPEKCSGLPVKQYSEDLLSATLKKWFEKIRCIQIEHLTPFNTLQHFLFCSFRKPSLT
jgi:ubiquinone/menaquinone biosynthesis C-methylase UbiE